VAGSWLHWAQGALSGGEWFEERAGCRGRTSPRGQLDPALVDRDGCSVITDARGEVTLTGESSNNEADDPEAVGGEGVLTKTVAIVAVVVEGAGSKREKNEGNE
jgi:hypothetical protein